MKATSSAIAIASLTQPIDRGIDTPLKVNATLSMFSSMAILLALGAAIAACIAPKEHRSSAKLKSGSKVMCHSCKYFHNNLYLNCTLHPSTVMTERAVDCRDYCPNQQTQRVKSWKKFIPFVGKIFPD
jgi:hypothetical protein